jgi:hypothetical protein
MSPFDREFDDPGRIPTLTEELRLARAEVQRLTNRWANDYGPVVSLCQDKQRHLFACGKMIRELRESLQAEEIANRMASASVQEIYERAIEDAKRQYKAACAAVAMLQEALNKMLSRPHCTECRCDACLCARAALDMLISVPLEDASEAPRPEESCADCGVHSCPSQGKTGWCNSYIYQPAPPAKAQLCGKYVGDNDATCPQLTCVRRAGHDGPCDNVRGDDEPSKDKP